MCVICAHTEYFCTLSKQHSTAKSPACLASWVRVAMQIREPAGFTSGCEPVVLCMYVCVFIKNYPGILFVYKSGVSQQLLLTLVTWVTHRSHLFPKQAEAMQIQS